MNKNVLCVECPLSLTQWKSFIPQPTFVHGQLWMQLQVLTLQTYHQVCHSTPNLVRSTFTTLFQCKWQLHECKQYKFLQLDYWCLLPRKRIKWLPQYIFYSAFCPVNWTPECWRTLHLCRENTNTHRTLHTDIPVARTFGKTLGNLQHKTNKHHTFFFLKLWCATLVRL